MSLSWKLLPITAALAVMTALVVWSEGPKPANANAVFVTASAVTAGSVYTVTATLTNSPAGTPATLVASGFGTFTGTPTAVVTPVGGTVTTPTGIGTNVLGIPGQSGGTAGDTITVSATFTCNSTGSVLFTLTQGSTSVNSSASTVSCGTGGGVGTGTLTVTPSLIPIGGQAVVTAVYTGTLNMQMLLQASGPGFFGVPTLNPNTGDVFSGQNTPTLSWLNLGSGTKQVQVLFTCSSLGNVSFGLSQAGQLIGQTAIPLNCGTGLPTPIPTVGLASQVSVASSPSSVNCNGTAFVTITVRNASGTFVADGTSVSLTTNTGSLSPTSATTLGGGVLAVYTAPSNSGGSASISATAGGATGSGNITVNCSAAAPTPVPAAPPPPPPPLSQTIISPPSTGSAGLQSAGDTRPYLGLILLATTGLVVAALKRVRS